MIPYNPSSFDTNKTLLENILELKKWLQAHPCYDTGSAVAGIGRIGRVVPCEAPQAKT